MDSLANYGSDDENDGTSSSNVNARIDPAPSGLEGDNYDDVQMDMSENPLNGSKAPSVQAQSPARCGGAPQMAPPACSTIPSESGSESAVKDDDGISSPPNLNHNSSSSSPASTAASHGNESDENNDDSKSQDLPSSSTKANPKEKLAKEKETVQPERDRSKKDLESRSNRDRDRNRERERDRERRRSKDRSRDRSRHRSRDRDSRRKSKERRSSSREHRRKYSSRRHTESNRRDPYGKRHRSRSRSVEKHRVGTDSRSSSSSGSSKSDARSREVKASTSAQSRSRSKSQEKERPRASGADSRKFYMEKKIDRKMNVLERMGIELKAEAKSSIGMVTPQMLVQRTMEQQVAQVRQATGVELPSYYNAAAVNPQRLVDQIQKRKLLWGAKKEEAKVAAPSQACNKWQGATFAQDQDGKLTAKFNRLMGIKQAAPAVAPKEGPSDINKKQDEMFHNMESQYEVARLATHTHRGLGLGFGTFQPR